MESETRLINSTGDYFIPGDTANHEDSFFVDDMSRDIHDDYTTDDEDYTSGDDTLYSFVEDEYTKS